MDQRLLPAAAPAVVSGAVDHRGRPAARGTTGRWHASLFIIGADMLESFAFFGVSANLITYFTGAPLRQPTAAAVAALNAWFGVSYILPLPCGFVADRWLGRHLAILSVLFLYIAGTGLLAISAAMPAHLPPSLQLAASYAALYAMAVGHAGARSNLYAFGGDQFDPDDPSEVGAKSSFFNWSSVGFFLAATVAIPVTSYVQDNVGWVIGFGVPAVAAVGALGVYVLGTRSYRFYEKGSSAGAAVGVEARGIAQLMPIWAASLMFFVSHAQMTTTFTKAAATMDRRIAGGAFEVPAASLQSIPSVALVVFLAVYDRLLVPMARKLSGHVSAITTLQRTGVGLLLGTAVMAMAALVEMRRLDIARQFGLLDSPEVPVPMSLWWLVPHYILFGVADSFVIVGLQEFLYSEVPSSSKSFGIALSLSGLGCGSLISGALVSAIDRVTGMSGRSWFSDNLNRAHLDYFYWLLAAGSAAFFLLFIVFSKGFEYGWSNCSAGKPLLSPDRLG